LISSFFIAFSRKLVDNSAARYIVRISFEGKAWMALTLGDRDAIFMEETISVREVTMSRIRLLVCLLLLAFVAVVGCSSDEDKKQSHFKKGKEYFEKEEFSSAEIELRNAVKLDPKFAEAHRYLGEIYLKLGKAKEAFKEYVELERIDPKNLDARKRLATFYFLGKKLDEAKKRVDSVLAEKPDDIDMLFLSAGIGEQEGRSADAEGIFNKIIGIDPKQVRAHLAMARLKASQEKFDEAEGSLKKAIEIDPQAVQPQLALFSLYVSMKDFDRAETEIQQTLKSNPKDLDLHILVGNYYKSRKENEKAEAAYTKAIEVDPANVKPYMVLGQFHEESGKDDLALQNYEKALSIQPDEVRVLDTLARFHFKKKNIEKTDEYIGKVLEKNPKFFATRMLKAEVLVLKREFAEALTLLDSLIEEQPDNARAYYFKGVAHLGKGETDVGKTALLKTVALEPDGYPKARMLLSEIYIKQGDMELAEKESRELLKKDPKDYQVQLILGNALMFQRKTAEAREVFKGLIAAEPQNAVGYFRLGLLDRMEKRPEDAMANFQKALEINPRLMDVFTHVIALMAEKKEFDAALKKCEEQLTIVEKSDPAQSMVHAVMGGLYLAKQDKQKAEAAFQTALQKNPNAVQPYYALARIYMSDDRTDKAIEQYDAVLKKNPNQAGPHMLLGTIYDMKKDFKLSEEHYRAALKVNPDFAPAANNLAYLMVEQGKDLNEALGHAQKAKELLPDDPNIMDTLGWVLYKKKLYPSAIREFEDALKKNPDSALITYHLGLAYADNNEKDKAKAALEKALSIDEKFDGAEDARKRIAEL